MPAHPLPPCHRASSYRVSAWLCGWLLLFSLLGVVSAAQADPLPLGKQGIHHLGIGGQLFLADNEAAPADAAALPAWLARQRPAADVDLFGGAYWLHARVRNDTDETAWVIDPNDTLIDLVDVHGVWPRQQRRRRPC